jgi:CRISPR-associated endonuclease Csn1
LAVYRGINAKGKLVSSFKVLNLLNATQSKQNKETLYPGCDESNGIQLNLYKTFKVGQIVILKETEDEDVFALPIEKLRNRIYSVIGLSSSGKQFFIKLTHLTISAPWSYMSASNFDNIQNFRRYEPQKLCCLTENTDFKITPSGEIIRL